MNPQKKKVLFHLPVQLKPVYYGTQGRIVGVLKYFSDRRDYISVDIVTANQRFKESYITPKWDVEQTQAALKVVDNVFTYEGKHNLLDFIYSRSKIFYHQKLLNQQLPIDTDYYSPPGYVQFVRSLAMRTSYDYAWINTVNFASLATPFKATSTQTIIDTHDIQSRLRLMLKEVLNFKNLEFDYDANFAKEVKALNHFSVIISDSNCEFLNLKQHLPSDKLYSIPHLVESLVHDSKIPSYQEREFQHDLVFVGMANTQNADGMAFFLDSIFPHLLKTRPETQLSIAGKICQDIKVKPDLAQNVRLLGYVPDLSKLYLQARVMICPLRTGAGTNVKLIEAMSYALPIVTTQKCASALSLQNHDNALISDEPIQFAEYIQQLLADSHLAQKLSDEIKVTYDQQYSQAAIYAKLDSMFGLSGLS